MKSIILKIVAQLLLYPLVAISIVFLFIGHNLPGGGFIGALIAGSAYTLHMIANGSESTRWKLRFNPLKITASGLLISASSMMISFVQGNPLMTGAWIDIPLPFGLYFPVGTPMLFDIGVFITVLGVILTIIINLAEEDE